MGRITRTLGLLAYGAVGLVVSALYLSLGYWLSDIVYEAGLWPVGMVMRVILLFSLLGLAAGALYWLVAVVMSPFLKSES